jgi:hypothetical protein
MMGQQAANSIPKTNHKLSFFISPLTFPLTKHLMGNGLKGIQVARINSLSGSFSLKRGRISG